MTKIEWTHRPGTKGESWNMVGGCTKVSPGCDNCYALSMSWRIQNMEKRPERYEGVIAKVLSDIVYPPYEEELHWTGRINLDYDALEIPYRWKKPRTVFVCSMADLFHEQVPYGFILSTFKVMYDNPQHTFLILTKRARRMLKIVKAHFHSELQGVGLEWRLHWPFPNAWLGVTAENQEQADLRIPLLLQAPAAVKTVSVEPMLGPVDLIKSIFKPGIWDAIHPDHNYALAPSLHGSGLDWVIIGCESGPNRRPMELEWALDLVRQCDAAKVAVFVKQLPINGRVSHDPNEWPAELQRREYPK